MTSGTRIGVRAAPVDASIEVEVWDEGRGLPEGKEQALFQRFVRGLKESAVPGVGLGLAICDTIVRAHGGSMRAENRSPRGARFVFTLPLEAAPQAGREQPGTPREEPSSTPRAPS